MASIETNIWAIGDEGMAPLLGAYTLEGAFLTVAPCNQRLVPVVGSLR